MRAMAHMTLRKSIGVDRLPTFTQKATELNLVFLGHISRAGNLAKFVISLEFSLIASKPV